MEGSHLSILLPTVFVKDTVFFALPCFFLDREPDKVEEPNNYFCGEASFVSVLKVVA